MDPDATYFAMYEAMRDGELQTARELALALQAWLAHDGFYPQRYSRTEVDAYLAGVLRRTAGDPVGAGLFPLGRVVITAAAAERLDQESVTQGLRRHASGDWGELDEQDRQENEGSLREGLRLLSAYTDAAQVRFWIITEADRSSTCVLLPEDY